MRFSLCFATPCLLLMLQMALLRRVVYAMLAAASAERYAGHIADIMPMLQIYVLLLMLSCRCHAAYAIADADIADY